MSEKGDKGIGECGVVDLKLHLENCDKRGREWSCM